MQDVTRLDLHKKFNLVIAPFRVFSHLIDIKDQLKALNQIYDHLNPNGLFIFDLFVPNLKMMVEGIDNKTDFEGEYEKGKKLKRITSMKTDLIHQINHVTFKFVWEEDDREITKEWHFPLRYYFRYELEHLISRSRLDLVTIFGDYNETELNADSREFVVVCKNYQNLSK